MAYIGREPQVGNFQVCDAISVVNGQAAYTMQVGGANVSPETANHMIVSLNGIIQAPGTSYTVAGSTITFASNLATGDVINFIHILGSVLDLGVPSNDTVGAAQIKDDLISGTTALASEPADTDEFLVSDAGTLKRIDYSLIKGGGMWEFISQTTVSSAVAQVDFTSLSSDFTDFCVVIDDLHVATDSARLDVRMFEASGGGSDIQTGNVYQWTLVGRDTSDVGTDSSGSDDKIRISRAIGNASQEAAHSEITLFNPHNTTDWTWISYKTAYSNAAGEAGVVTGAGYTNHGVSSDYSVSGIRFFPHSGNISTGKFSLYGRKHS